MSGPRALSCPQCGGTVAPPLSSRKTECSFCRRPLFYAGEEFLPRYALPPRLGPEALHGRCLEAFRTLYVPADLSVRSLLLQKQRSYVPFYLLTGKRGGVLTSRRGESGRRIPSLRPREHRLDALGLPSAAPAAPQWGFPADGADEEESAVVLGDFRYLYPAADLGAWAAAELHLRSSVLDHLEEAEPALLADLARSGEVVDVSLPLERLLERGVAAAAGAGEISVLEVHPVLVYLPLTTFTFRYGRHVFSLTLEEITGSWVCGTLPFRREWALLLGLGTVAVLSLVVGRAGALFLHYDWGAATPTMVLDRQFMGALSLLLGAACACGSLAAFAGAWALVRAPYRVIQTPDGQLVELAGTLPRSPLAPVNGLVKRVLAFLVDRKGRRR